MAKSSGNANVTFEDAAASLRAYLARDSPSKQQTDDVVVLLCRLVGALIGARHGSIDQAAS